MPTTSTVQRLGALESSLSRDQAQNANRARAARARRAERQRQQAAQSNTTTAAKNADPNPRAATNQSQAQGPQPGAQQIVPEQQRGQNVPGVNVDSSQLRFNSRRADANVDVQNANRINTLLQNGVGIPIQGLQNATPIFSSLVDAEQAANAEFVRTGSVSPGTEAAIARFRDPSLSDKPLSSGRNFLDVLGGLSGVLQQGQNAQDIIAGANNQQLDASGRRIANFGGFTSNDPNDQTGEISRIRTLRQQGLNPDGSQRFLIDPATGQPTTPAPVASQENVDQNQVNLQNIISGFGRFQTGSERGRATSLVQDINDLDAAIANPGGIKNESPAAFEIRKASLMAQRQQRLDELDLLNRQEQERALRETQAAAGTEEEPTTTTTDTAGDQQVAPEAEQTGQLPFDPARPAESIYENITSRALSLRDQMLTDIGEVDMEGFEAEKAELKDDLFARLDLVDEIDTLKRLRAEEKQERKLRENTTMRKLQDVTDKEAIFNKMRDNEKAEVRARRRINKLSGGHDFSGVKYVQEEIEKGESTLRFMKQRAVLMQGKHTDKALDIMNGYYFDLEQADLDKKTNYAEEHETYKSDLRDIKSDMRLDETERRKLRQDAHKNYSDNLFKTDMRRGDEMFKSRTQALDRMFELEDQVKEDRRNNFSDGISLMNLLDNKNVSSSPQTVRYAEKMMGLAEGSLGIIAGGTENGGIPNIPGYTQDQVATAMSDYFEANNNLPSKREIQTMVDVFYKNRAIVQGGQSSADGTVQPDIYSNPFNELNQANQMTSAIAEYDRAVADGSFVGSFFQWKETIGSFMFKFGGAGPSPQGLPSGQGQTPSTQSSSPGVTSFSSNPIE